MCSPLRRVGRGVALAALWLLAGLGPAGCDERRDPTQSAPGASESEPQRAPNLVLITLDTTRADALGAYGQAQPTTPNLDRIAADGVMFEQAMTSSPETLPSHATIFTALQPFTHGVRSNAGYVVSDRHVTLAEALAEHGYRTGAEIAAAVLGEQTGIGQGFEHLRDASSSDARLLTVTFDRDTPDQKVVTEPVRVGDDITRRGIEFIERNRSRPFFLWLHYFDAHSPYNAPSEFHAAIPGSPYHAAVASLDREVGRVVESIENLRLRERTLVVVTADHGEGLDEHGEATHSFFVYDTTMRVPLVFWGLDSKLARLSADSLARTVDIAPTVLDLLGLPGLPGAQGVSLVGRTGAPPAAYGESGMVYREIFGIPPLRTLREGRWKYIHKVSPELYDVVADPGELSNRILEEPAEAERLRARLEAMIRAAPPPPDDAISTLDSKTAAELTALGYVASAPTPVGGRELELLELSGDDPVSKASDVRMLAVSSGLVKRQAYEKALPDLRTLVERNPDSGHMLALLAESLLGVGAGDEAIPVLRHLRELGAATPNETAKLASLLARRGARGEAVSLLKEAVAAEPCHEGALSDLNLLYRAESRFETLVETLERAARECPELASNLNNYAWALATLPRDDLRDGSRAIEVARAALVAAGDDDPGTLDTLAAALAESGDFAEAVRVQSGAVEQLEAARAPKEVIEVFAEHLASFEARRPLRDP